MRIYPDTVHTQAGTRRAFLYSIVIPILITTCVWFMGTALTVMETTLQTSPFTVFELKCTGSECEVILLNNSYSFQHISMENVKADTEKYLPLSPPFIRIIAQAGDAASEAVSMGCAMLFE